MPAKQHCRLHGWKTPLLAVVLATVLWQIRACEAIHDGIVSLQALLSSPRAAMTALGERKGGHLGVDAKSGGGALKIATPIKAPIKPCSVV
jgi:hypothetical protein